MPRSPDHLARRYVAWIKQRALAIIAAHVVLLVGALYLIATQLPLYADFSYLLPQDAAAVKDLRKLEARVRATDVVIAMVEAPTPEDRAAAVTALATGFRAIAPDLVDQVDVDQADTRTFLERNQHLLVPLADLERAHAALDRKLAQAKLDANPLFIDLDAEDEDPAATSKEQEELEQLRAKRRDVQAQLARLSNVSADGRIAILQIRTPFRATDAGRGQALLAALEQVRAQVLAAHPAVNIGFTGSVVTSVAEHGAIAEGMLLSTLITGVLCAIVLLLYFRSATLLGMLIGTLGVGTTISFGIAAVTVGHLNAATAFLGAIIAGNGINYGIMLIARYLEERRRHDLDEAMSAAIVGTLRPTAIASIGAAIAYGSLAATSFKGFADFAIIGSIGMLVCWVASYLLLPALVLRFGRATRVFYGDPAVGGTLVRLFGFRSSRLVVIIALVTAIGAGVIVARYIADDPVEYDIKRLRSEGPDAVASRGWMALSDKTFGRGISGRTVIAADTLAQVPLIVDALQRVDDGRPPAQKTIGDIWSIFSFVPDQQPAKLAVLAQIRALLDGAADALDDQERAELLELRPPDELAPITMASLPPGLRDRFREKNDSLGLLIEVRPFAGLDEWNGKDLIRFASAVRELELRDGQKITSSGSSVIFADIVESIERDGPFVTGVAAIGLIVMVLLLVGLNRRSFAVLISTAAGTLLMVAVCAVIGLKVNFLDFVALPITLGLGIDYAINMAHRHDQDELADPHHTLSTSGAAVFLCALTTIIGYGSLLVSDNLAIRGFGTASLIGEIACLLSALILVPAILVVVGRRPRLLQ